MRILQVLKLTRICLVLFSINLPLVATTLPQKMSESDVKVFLDMGFQGFEELTHSQGFQDWHYAEAKIPIRLANCADCAPYITIFRERSTNGRPTVGARGSWSTLWKMPKIVIGYAKILSQRGRILLHSGVQKLFSWW